MGGSKQQSSTVQQMSDPEAARRMAAVAEEQQKMARQQWSLAREIYEPYERRIMQEGIRDLEMSREAKDLARQQGLEEMKMSRPAMEAFYKEAGAPVNVAERQAEAEAGVVGEYASVPGSIRRQIARTGTNLSPERHNNLMKAIALDRARAISGARASARTEARDETFAKLKAAMAARSGQSITPNTAAQEGGYAVKNPADRAMGLYANVINAHEAGMRPLSTSKSSGWSFSV